MATSRRRTSRLREGPSEGPTRRQRMIAIALVAILVFSLLMGLVMAFSEQ